MPDIAHFNWADLARYCLTIIRFFQIFANLIFATLIFDDHLFFKKLHYLMIYYRLGNEASISIETYFATLRLFPDPKCKAKAQTT